MGMYSTSTTKDMPAVVLLAGFQAQCTLPVIGAIQMFINDAQKNVFTIKEVTLNGLEAGNPAVSIAVGELFIVKRACHLIGFEQMYSHDETGLMARGERLAVYTSHFVIQGTFHMGADSLLSDFMASSKAPFLGITDVDVFPLFQAQSALVQHFPLAYIHQETALMHHRV